MTIRDSINRILRTAEGDRRIWAHWQNLNEDRDGKIKGPGWRHGRGWLNVTELAQFRAEWQFPSRAFGLSVGVSSDAEDVLDIQLCIPPVGIYLGFESWSVSRLVDKAVKRFGLKGEFDWGGFARDVSVKVHDWGVYWNIWRNPHGCTSRDWRHSARHPLGFPGERIGDPEVRQTVAVLVPMPERSYRGTAIRSVMTCRHLSFPLLRKTITTIDIDMEKGEQIPVPGKGENSWDCDEDAIFGSGGGGAETVEDAIGNLVASALRTRRRYGGANWKPEEKTEAAQ